MILDILFLVLLFMSTIVAFLRGFVREALTLISLGAALAAAYYLGPVILPTVEGWLGVTKDAAEEPAKLFGVVPAGIAAQMISRAGIFFTVVLTLSIISHFLAEAIKSLGLGAIDRSMGAAFGIVRAAAVAVILFLPVHLLVEEKTQEEWFSGSRSYVYLQQGAQVIAGYLPKNFVQDKKAVAEEAVVKSGAAESARAKLQAMDLLREDLTPEERAKMVREKMESGELQKAFGGEGYTDEFRNEIDTMFKQAAPAGSAPAVVPAEPQTKPTKEK